MNVDLTFAQFTDCHLFADKQQQHYGAPVYQNLVKVLTAIKQMPSLDFAIFTGDLTQDHTDKSYQCFVDAVAESQCTLPLYWVAGNHDEIATMSQFLNSPPFKSAKEITNKNWQILMLNSKSATPAGKITTAAYTELHKKIDPSKHQMLVMHHHAANVGYFIDRHPLNNQEEFWRQINPYPSIKAIICGHVHNGLVRLHPNSKHHVPVITCPATSIQFSQTSENLSSANLPAGFRVHQLYSNGKVNSTEHFIATQCF